LFAVELMPVVDESSRAVPTAIVEPSAETASERRASSSTSNCDALLAVRIADSPEAVRPSAIVYVDDLPFAGSSTTTLTVLLVGAGVAICFVVPAVPSIATVALASRAVADTVT
jgi:hypothetical protein